MTLSLDWKTIALRLAASVVVGALLGYNRAHRGKAAGMSTTVLVCVAAAISMLQVNLLLPTAGRAADSFVMNDLMRLPLGILTGVGFIGAGAILRQGSIVIGVTTAATLWLATVLGLCLGGGQTMLGLVGTAIGLLALWGLKAIEDTLPREHRSRLSVWVTEKGPGEEQILRQLRVAGLNASSSCVSVESSGLRALVFQVRHVPSTSDARTPEAVSRLALLQGVAKLQWRTLM